METTPACLRTSTQYRPCLESTGQHQLLLQESKVIRSLLNAITVTGVSPESSFLFLQPLTSRWAHPSGARAQPSLTTTQGSPCTRSRKHPRSLTGHPGHAILQADHRRLRLGKLFGVFAVAVIRGVAALYSSKGSIARQQSLFLKAQGGFEGR